MYSSYFYFIHKSNLYCISSPYSFVQRVYMYITEVREYFENQSTCLYINVRLYISLCARQCTIYILYILCYVNKILYSNLYSIQ